MRTTLSEKTNTTPKVVFNHNNNTLSIEGKSILFEPELFWALIINQIKKYEIKTIMVKLNYINTNSILHLIKLINLKQNNVIWFYEESDEDLLELGKDLEVLSNNLFEFVVSDNLESSFTDLKMVI